MLNPIISMASLSYQAAEGYMSEMVSILGLVFGAEVFNPTWRGEISKW